MPHQTTIALVDDDPEAGERVCKALAAGGHQPRQFRSGQEFLLAYEPEQATPPDIAVFDIHMPGMDGTELCRRASQIEKFDRTVFVAFTGRFGSDDACWLRHVGFDFVVTKAGWKGLLKIVSRKENLVKKPITRRYSDLSAALATLSQLRMRTIELEEKYVKKLISPEVFALLEKSPEDLAPKFQSVAVGFADVRGFTQLSNRLQTFQVSHILQLFFKHTALLVRQGGGFLDKFIGDSVMWFHQSGSIKASCAECLETAARILSNMEPLNEVIQRRLHMKLGIEIGMGIACGNAAVGIFGAPEIRIHYGVLGPPVNLAARLCAEAPAGTLLIGGEAIEHCTYPTEPVAFRAIKGFDHEVEVRQVLVPKLPLDQEWHFLLNA